MNTPAKNNYSEEEVLLEFEKGRYWSLTLPAHWQGKAMTNVSEQGLFHVTVMEAKARELINQGMECHLSFGENQRVAGRVESISASDKGFSLEIKAA